MKNIFAPIDIEQGTPNEFLAWGYSLRNFFPSTDPLISSSPILNFFYSNFLPESSHLKTFKDLPFAIAKYFGENGYADTSVYANKCILQLEKTLDQNRYDFISKSFSPKMIYFLEEDNKNHPANQVFYSLMNIFSPSSEYLEDLSDILVLSYSYAKTLTPNIKNSDLIVQNYHKEMYKRGDSYKGISLRTFSDSLYRIKKKNNGKLPLPSFISSRLFDSYLDIEVVSNLLRFTDPNKNPFLSLIDTSHYKNEKKFSLEKFLSSFHSISLNSNYIELKGISSYRLYSQNQYVLERLTNANFILGIYELEHYIHNRYGNFIRPGQLNEINDIDPELLDEIKNWIYFPLLTTRLRLLSCIYKEIPNILLLYKPYPTIIKDLLKTIRLYHLHVLLPLLIQLFLYITTVLELINKPSLKKSEVGSEEHISTIKNLQKQLLKSPLSPFIQTFAEINIDKNLEEYLSSSKSRLTYFSPDEKVLHPKMYLDFLGIDEHKDISAYNFRELNLLSKKIYIRFQNLANQYASYNINNSPFQKELINQSYAQHIENIFNSTREENFYVPKINTD